MHSQNNDTLQRDSLYSFEICQAAKSDSLWVNHNRLYYILSQIITNVNHFLKNKSYNFQVIWA